MNEAMVKEWSETVWMKRPGVDLDLPNMLVLNTFRGHICPAVKEAIQKANTDLVIIPGSVMVQLQPLDVAINKPFKDCLAKSYREWLAKDNAAMTPTERCKKAPFSEVTTW